MYVNTSTYHNSSSRAISNLEDEVIFKAAKNRRQPLQSKCNAASLARIGRSPALNLEHVPCVCIVSQQRVAPAVLMGILVGL